MCGDVELITASRNGDDEAFQFLVSEYMKFAREKAKGFISSNMEYDDIVQEAMLGFLSAYYSFDINGAASFRTYVSVCMNNRITSVINSLERKKRIPREAIVPLDDVSFDDSADTGENPEEVFFRRQNAEEILRRVEEELSERERKVLSLFMSGMKYDEIAAALEIAPKSVDNTIQRIRKKLRRTGCSS